MPHQARLPRRHCFDFYTTRKMKIDSSDILLEMLRRGSQNLVALFDLWLQGFGPELATVHRLKVRYGVDIRIVLRGRVI